MTKIPTENINPDIFILTRSLLYSDFAGCGTTAGIWLREGLFPARMHQQTALVGPLPATTTLWLPYAWASSTPVKFFRNRSRKVIGDS